jgi:hypothetical protein
LKILFTVQPLFGHFHIMVPLASALKAEGHDVFFATGKAFGHVVERAGFKHLPCGFDFDGSGEILFQLPEWREIEAEISDVGRRAVNGFVRGLGPRMADDLIALLPSLNPDLVIRDMMEVGGYIAAELAGVPHATISWGFYASIERICPQALRNLKERYELSLNNNLHALDPTFRRSRRSFFRNFIEPRYLPGYRA